MFPGFAKKRRPVYYRLNIALSAIFNLLKAGSYIKRNNISIAGDKVAQNLFLGLIGFYHVVRQTTWLSLIILTYLLKASPPLCYQELPCFIVPTHG